jgi:hypothetical protein
MPSSSYYQRNKQRVLERMRNYYLQHRDTKIKYALEYQKINKDRKRIWNNIYKQRVRRDLLALLGSVCVICGTTERIEVDHKLAGGSKDRLEKGNNHDMYRYYLKHPQEAKEKLQLLCKTHNLVKEHHNREHWRLQIQNPRSVSTNVSS